MAQRQRRSAAARPVRRHRPGRRRRPATRTRAPATRASCSATPAAKRPNSCRRRSITLTRSCAGSRRRAIPAPKRRSDPTPRARLPSGINNGKPVEATQIVVSHQHLVEALTSEDVADLVRPYVAAALPQGWITAKTVWHINPTGKFFIGGPDGDCGLTGRKIIVDTYGGAAPHGGGAFSGKDPTKVDRSAAYAARYLAKNVVAAGLADRCTLQLSYAIGVARPLSIYADLHGTGHIDEAKLETALMDVMNFTPRGIREHLNLNRPIFARTSAYGHFGRAPEAEGGFSWEKTDLADTLRALA